MKKWIGLFLAVFLLVICLVGAAVAYFKIRDKRQIDAVNTVAEKLGYAPQDQLAQTRRCWDTFAHCGVFLYFGTDVPLDEIQARTQQLGFTQKRFDRIDGYSIFTDINLGTEQELTVDGNDGLENRDALPEPDAHKWHLDDAQSQRWVIGFYDLTGTGTQYAIDGEEIPGRIVSVMLRTR